MSDGWLRLDFSSCKLDALREQFRTKATRLHEVLFTRVQKLAYMLQGKVVAKLSGEVLKRRTGILAGSVTATTTTDGSTILGTVEAGKGASHSYAMIHTLGHEGAYKIMAMNKRALMWQMSVKAGAEKVFVRSVTHPTIPATPFVWPTLDENRAEIIQEIARTVADVLREK